MHRWFYAFNPETKQHATYHINPMMPGGYREQIYDAVLQDFKTNFAIYTYAIYYDKNSFKLISNHTGNPDIKLEIL